MIPRYAPSELGCGSESPSKSFVWAKIRKLAKMAETKSTIKAAEGSDKLHGDRELSKSCTDKDRIRPFDLKKLPIPRRRERYNDDVIIEHFPSSAKNYDGHQRKGVIDEHLECLSLVEHVDQALNIPFVLALSVPPIFDS